MISFACFGLATEVVFSALYDFYQMLQGKLDFSYRLMGYTYLWMIPLYGSIPIMYHFFDKMLIGKPLILRIIFGVLLIYVFEFVSGFLLETITGTCPWKYSEGWHFKGYIRFDYALFWAFFIFIVDKKYNFFKRIIPDS